MHYTDRVYGTGEITEPVILELIADPALQRLKGVDQAGYRPLWVYPDADITSEEFSRFSHSVGVFLLLRKYSASLEEQIAGLLHDVSHSSFSHCIDYALTHRSGATQEHQDKYFQEYVSRTHIPTILEKHGFDPQYILDEKNFSLLEQPVPDLCADRIDYALRNAEAFEEAWTHKRLDALLDALTAKDGRWVFREIASAQSFAELFRHLNNTYFASFLGAVMLQTVGDYLADALEKKYITYDDLYTTDQDVLTKIQPHHNTDATLKTLYQRMHDRNHAINNPAAVDRVTSCKSRIVDPYCIVNGKTMRLSDAQPEWKSVVQAEQRPKTYYIKFT